ncbi:hypothetical protein IE077_002026, partial [Cardiosporidium cionae]
PPICPHDRAIANCLQCYTSDDDWLSLGAWKRFSRVDANSGIVLDSMSPLNPELLPRFPLTTDEYEIRVKKLAKKMKTFKIEKGNNIQSALPALPVHLWVLLGGKDMMALDGISTAWKFLRWASEIPPSEFWEADEVIQDRTIESPEEGHGTTWWQGKSPLDVFQLYHR